MTIEYQYTFPGGLPRWFSGKESACSVEDLVSIPGLGRSPGGGRGKPLQYSCLENPMDRGARQAAVHGVAGSDRTEVAVSTLPTKWRQQHSFPGGSGSKESACSAGDLGSIAPWRRERLPTPVVLPGGLHGQRSLAGYI